MRIDRIMQMTGFAVVLMLLALQAAAAQAAKADIKDAKGKSVASATLTQTQAGVLIRLAIKGLPAGERAVHIHAVGKCEAPFTSAGPHFNPGNHKHGIMSGAAHAGDMPNLHIPQSGELTVEILNAAVTLDKGKPNSLFDDDGSAMVIHAKPDDYKSDPAGDAGDRIACGIIQ
jgi:superoxide dismutase, Cu-Zn family